MENDLRRNHSSFDQSEDARPHVNKLQGDIQESQGLSKFTYPKLNAALKTAPMRSPQKKPKMRLEARKTSN